MKTILNIPFLVQRGSKIMFNLNFFKNKFLIVDRLKSVLTKKDRRILLLLIIFTLIIAAVEIIGITTIMSFFISSEVS
jgi:hypothetical protein